MPQLFTNRKTSACLTLILAIQIFCTIFLNKTAAKTFESADLPNIILVMADDQGYGDAGFTGHKTLKTPHMDAMSKSGIVFNRFYAGSAVCSPTRASVMTGRTPNRVNVPNHGHYLRPQETTIAEALKTVGYSTGHFGKWHIGSVQPDSPTSPGGQGFDEWLSGLNFFDQDPYLSRNGVYEQVKGQGSVISMDATIKFVEKHHQSENPFFAVCWFPAPHDPHTEKPVKVEGLVPFEGKMKGYYDEIQLIDQQLGRLRKKLRELKIADNTIVWYCSDNGGLNKETSGGRERKGSIYEGGLRIPCIVEWPKEFKSGSIDVPAVTSDIYPTLVAITNSNVKNQAPLDGVDLSNIIDRKQTSRPPIGFWHKLTGGQSTRSDAIIKKLLTAKNAGEPNPFPNRILKNVNKFPKWERGKYNGHAALNAWPWKLHRIENKNKVRYELYNLDDDPMEKTDLLGKKPEIAKKLKSDLATWQSSVFDSLEGKDY